MGSTMDRMMTYPGELWRSADFLNSEKNALYAVGSLIQAILGTTTCVDGLQIAATSPASMQVTIGAGVIFAQEPVDATAYAGLGTDANTIMKQGLLKGPATLTITAPSTSGYSQVYLVQAAYVDQDAGSAVLPYRNSANPDQPYAGPNNSGTSQYTQRNGVCVIGLKAGVAAPTGSQAAPTADAGYVPLWRVTVANGATSITSANWVVDPAAPFINPKLFGISSALSVNLSNYVTNTALAAAGYITAGTLVGVQKITASGTYTPTTGAKRALVFATGGGGSGTSGASVGTGGGAGSTAIAYVDLTSVSTVTCTIGAGGVANSGGGSGTAGGTTSFGTYAVAGGGAAGVVTSGYSQGVAGGTATAGTMLLAGAPGGSVKYVPSSVAGGDGGSSFWGGGGLGSDEQSGTNHVGGAGLSYGAGGGGGDNSVGGNGAAGVILVLEFK